MIPVLGWLEKFDLARWWLAAISFGVGVTIVATTVKEHAVVLVGFGIVACGFGEWMNHQIKSVTEKEKEIVTEITRINPPQGMALVVVGIILMAIGVYRLTTS
jgi:uncharacterized membrane protein YidH (DUF202 family)